MDGLRLRRTSNELTIHHQPSRVAPGTVDCIPYTSSVTAPKSPARQPGTRLFVLYTVPVRYRPSRRVLASSRISQALKPAEPLRAHRSPRSNTDSRGHCAACARGKAPLPYPPCASLPQRLRWMSPRRWIRDSRTTSTWTGQKAELQRCYLVSTLPVPGKLCWPAAYAPSGIVGILWAPRLQVNSQQRSARCGWDPGNSALCTMYHVRSTGHSLGCRKFPGPRALEGEGGEDNRRTGSPRS